MKKFLFCLVGCMLFSPLFSQVDPEPITIQNDVVFSAESTSGDIIVAAGAHMQVNGLLRVSDNASIIINPGGKLTVNGGTITGMGSNRMWKGIVVLGNASYGPAASMQGHLVLKNAVIENAVNGVCVWNGLNTSTSGGVVHADNTTFRNNKQAVEFGPYGASKVINPLAPSYFKNCVFTINNSHYLAANGHTFFRHVYLNGKDQVSFTACNFKNETILAAPGSSQRGYGLYSTNSYFTISGYCHVISITEPQLPIDFQEAVPAAQALAPCAGSFRSSYFNGFYNGIYVSNSSTNNNNFGIRNTIFSNNYYGIQATGVRNPSISDCGFNTTFQGNVREVYFNNCTGYSVMYNSFNNQVTSGRNNYGIYISNSGVSDNVIYMNDFINQGYAIYASGNNGDNLVNGTGLYFQCNYFSGNRNAIYIANNAVVKVQQGTASSGADNKFYNNTTDIRANAQYMLLYHHSSGNNHAPVNYEGNVFISANATAAYCIRPYYSPGIESYTENAELGSARSTISSEDPLSSALHVEVYPNPVTDHVNIVFSEEPGDVAKAQFFDVMGRCVHTESLSGQRSTIDLGKLSKGVYFYRITRGGEIIGNSKIVKH